MKTLRIIALLLLASISSANAQSVANSNSTNVLYSGLDEPSALFVTQQALYIIEQGKSRVLQLDRAGQVLQTFGNKGSSDYQFNSPFDIDATNGLKIFVSDLRNNRIQVFDKHWQLLSSIKNFTAFRDMSRIEPTWLGVNEVGELFFYDKRSKKLIKLNESGSFLDEIPIPLEVKDISGLQLRDNKIFILDKKVDVIHQLSENGFYESFYPAEGAQTFWKSKNGMWISVGNTLYKSGMEKKDAIDVKAVKSIKDFVATEELLFVLSEDKLISITIPKE